MEPQTIRHDSLPFVSVHKCSGSDTPAENPLSHTESYGEKGDAVPQMSCCETNCCRLREDELPVKNGQPRRSGSSGAVMVFGKRTYKPNSVVCGHSSRRRVAADTHQRPTRRFRQLLEPPGRIGQMRSASLALGSRFPPYLVLLRVGFTLPPTLLPERCALTAPFHPYPGTGTAVQANLSGAPGWPTAQELRGSRGGIFSVALAVCAP